MAVCKPKSEEDKNKTVTKYKNEISKPNLKKIYHFKKVEYIKELNQNITCSFKQIQRCLLCLSNKETLRLLFVMILLRKC